MVLRKNALESAPGGSPFTFCGGPAETERVAACAPEGTSTATPMATAAILRVLLKSCTSCVGRGGRPGGPADSNQDLSIRGIFRGVLTALVAVALLAPAWTPGLKAANHYADGRPGEVAFAVRTEKDVWGRGLDRRVQSASVVKALLLVAYLRQPDVRSRDLTSEERHFLSPMIRRSDNHDASTVVARLGAAKVDRTAHHVGMRRFHLDRAIWGRSLITAR